MQKTWEGYRGFLAGLGEVVRDAPPKDPRVQTAVLLLRLCGQGKATHLLRTLPPPLTQDFAGSLDAATAIATLMVASPDSVEARLRGIHTVLVSQRARTACLDHVGSHVKLCEALALVRRRAAHLRGEPPYLGGAKVSKAARADPHRRQA